MKITSVRTRLTLWNVLVLALRQTIHGAKIEAAEVSPYSPQASTP